MVIRDVTSRFRNEVKEHYHDSVLSNRLLWNIFWTASRLVLQRNADDNKLWNQNIFTTINVDTEEVNKFAGTCVPLECAICRAKIPKPLTSKTGFIYNFVGSPDFHTSFSVVNQFEFGVKTKIKTATNFAFIDGEYMYFSKCLPCVKIVGLFEEFSDTQVSGLCSVMDTEVNLPDYLIEPTLRMAKENLGIFLQKTYDHVANKNTQS